jgi:hypothetical protein
MKTITIKTYSYAELSDQAKERARQWFREGMEYDGEFQIDDAKQCLAFLGFDVSKVYFTGFSSQGDGACFAGSFDSSKFDLAALKSHAPTDCELHNHAERLAVIVSTNPPFIATVEHFGRYSHEGCTQFSFCESPISEAWEADFIGTARNLMQWIYRQLEKDYEWNNADEQVAEAIECNEYQFTEDGKRSVIL